MQNALRIPFLFPCFKIPLPLLRLVKYATHSNHEGCLHSPRPTVSLHISITVRCHRLATLAVSEGLSLSGSWLHLFQLYYSIDPYLSPAGLAYEGLSRPRQVPRERLSIPLHGYILFALSTQHSIWHAEVHRGARSRLLAFLSLNSPVR